MRYAKFRRYAKPSLIFFIAAVFGGVFVGRYVAPTWTVEKTNLDVHQTEDGRLYYIQEKEQAFIDAVVPMAEAALNDPRIAQLNARGESPDVKEEYVFQIEPVDTSRRNTSSRSSRWMGSRQSSTTVSWPDVIGGPGRCCRPWWRWRFAG